MTNPNDERVDDRVEGDGREPGPALEFAQRARKPTMTSPPPRPTPSPTPVPSKVVIPAGIDVLPTLTPARAVAVRDVPSVTRATNSCGTAKTGDTSRAAGYVADLTKTNEPPPGLPIAKSPANFAGPESAMVPPIPPKQPGQPNPAKRDETTAAGPTPPIPDPAGSDPALRSTPPISKSQSATAQTPSRPPNPASPGPGSTSPHGPADTHQTILLPSSDIVE
jgi:hypothetical protein